MVPYLAGQAHPQGKRLVNSQVSFRTEDIEEIGDHRHDTLFEMLGNWSLGDYFKKEHLNWLYEFLVEEIKLDPNKLYQTVFAGSEYAPKDEESIEILKDIFRKYKINAEVGPQTLGKGDLGSGQEIEFGGNIKIFPYCDKNWWKRGDAVGELGGPDSETFYDTGKEHNPKFGKFCHLNCDCGRFIEIGNSVFMEYIKTEKGWEKKLPQRNVDFGGGLERMVMAANNKTNIFETDLFDYLIKFLEEKSGKKYEDNYASFEIIADHIRAATFLIANGGVPSNKDQGYVVRRLIRRSLVYMKKLDIPFETAEELSQLVINYMSDVYPELDRNKNVILGEIKKEREKFGKTLENGIKALKKIFGRAIGGIDPENLPKGMRIENNKIRIDGSEIFRIYETHGLPIEISQEIMKGWWGMAFDEQTIREAREAFKEAFKKHQELSRTASAGKFKGGLADASEETTRLHTAAHLLLESLRRVLGNHIFQKGSNITAERLRFDFSHLTKLTDEEKKKVEDLVNEQIQKKLPVVVREMSLDEAKKIGAMGVFESKYGDKVKVYIIGESDDIFSKEICGGPHIKNTSELGEFKIKKEESSSAGVRRIKAILK